MANLATRLAIDKSLPKRSFKNHLRDGGYAKDGGVWGIT
jgi:hypothetical protein